MSFNKETFELMIKLALAMIVILLVIWLLAEGTPKAAKLVDKLLGKLKVNQGANSVPVENQTEDDENNDITQDSEYRVYDIYEGTPSEESKQDEEKNNDKKD
jgi:Sec-independent protein translocase protein TatA